MVTEKVPVFYEARAKNRHHKLYGKFEVLLAANFVETVLQCLLSNSQLFLDDVVLKVFTAFFVVNLFQRKLL